MKQTIVIARPPIYDRCDAQFHIAGKPILFSWGDKIYNPMDVDIPHELIAHEAAHGAQQGTEEKGIRRWWDQYLADPQFRLYEELLGHRAEWREYMRRHPNGKDSARVLEAIAGRLSSELYGNVISLDDARSRVMLRAG